MPGGSARVDSNCKTYVRAVKTTENIVNLRPDNLTSCQHTSLSHYIVLMRRSLVCSHAISSVIKDEKAAPGPAIDD